MNAQPYLSQALSEIQVRWSVVDRIATQDQQHVYIARIHVPRELAQRFRLIHGIGFKGLGVEHRRIGIVQSMIHCVRQGVHCRRLEFTCNHDARAPVPLKVARHGLDPLRPAIVGL